MITYVHLVYTRETSLKSEEDNPELFKVVKNPYLTLKESDCTGILKKKITGKSHTEVADYLDSHDWTLTTSHMVDRDTVYEVWYKLGRNQKR